MNNYELSKDSSINDVSKNSLSKKNDLNSSSNLDRDHLRIISEIKPLIEISEYLPVGYIVELGSNQKAQHHLKLSRAALEAKAVSASWSTEYINPDYTATPENPKPDYTNQCGYLQLHLNHNHDDDGKTSQSLGELVKASKVLEKQIQQDFYQAEQIDKLDVDTLLKSIVGPKNRQVIIDIDILAIMTESEGIIAVAERYPFKHHEWVGLIELYDKKLNELPTHFRA